MSQRAQWIRFGCFCACVVALLCFIYGNSLKQGEASAKQSGTVVETVRPVAEPILESVHIEPTTDTITHLVRKGAHFTEFFALGVFAWFSAWAFPKKSKVRYTVPFPFCALCAGADEFLQRFVSGRSGQLKDVLLDTSGALCGILCGMLCVFLAVRITKFFKKA